MRLAVSWVRSSGLAQVCCIIRKDSLKVLEPTEEEGPGHWYEPRPGGSMLGGRPVEKSSLMGL